MTKKIKLNIGCAKRLIKDYVNIDENPINIEGYEFKQASLFDLPYADETVDEILAELVLEHLPYSEHREALWEFWRNLKFGGILTIVVPDFEQVIKYYFLNIKDLKYNTKFDVLQNCFFELIGYSETKKNMEHKSLFTSWYLERILEQEGFKIQKIKCSQLQVFVEAKKVKKVKLR